ncbi:probable transmembrane protein [Marinomonas sp. MED121]|nr:probable transmembrane protein [Marinomonas sp. MED121]
MFAMTGLPLSFAWAMVFTDWRPSEITAKGEFLSEPIAWDSISSSPLAGEEGTWRLLVVEEACQAKCLERLESYRRMHVALGRKSDGLSRVLLTQEQIDNQDKFLYLDSFSSLDADSISNLKHKAWLVDPKGWLVMSFKAEQDAAELHKDILKLLKNNFQG